MTDRALKHESLERALEADSPWRFAEALSDLLGALAAEALEARAECAHAWQEGSAGSEWGILAKILKLAELKLERQYQELRPLGARELER